ncbi:MAG TPA: hypothetical protein VLG09_00100 [Candidatus Saccharimonadales bacterium]|nr:hypothetical protein [Candidatus Saccharimonadales bacterium]
MTLKEMVTKGGYARAAKLTKERRIEIAKLAGQASALKRTLEKRKQNDNSSEHKTDSN